MEEAVSITTQTTHVTPADLTTDDHELLEGVRRQFEKTVASRSPLFTSAPRDLWNTFLGYLPAELQRTYSCTACRHFIERYGELVVVDALGFTRSALWNESEVPEVFRQAIAALRREVERGHIDGVFLSTARTWGTPETGPWRHFAVAAPAVWNSRTQTAGQRRAELREDYAILQRSLSEFSIEVASTAVTVLTSGAVFRSEKCIGVAKWFLDLHERRATTQNTRVRDNWTWLAAATAPKGFCHIRSTVIGTLLEDIAEGLPYDEVKSRFEKLMNPLQYQRPTSAPSAANVAQAEKLVESLGITRSLERRYARLDEIQTIWRPTPMEPAPVREGGVFAHLTTKNEQQPASPTLEVPAVRITWEKFARTVLPEAQTIEYVISSSDNFIALVTAVHDDAPPILRWDREDRRNPFSWYVYPSGSAAAHPRNWNLSQSPCRVTAITRLSARWYDTPNEQDGDGVILVLDGARDLSPERGMGFFPEMLRSELHPVRATLEAYAKAATVSGDEEASACGVDLRKGQQFYAQVRVTTRTGVSTYRFDRWD